MKEEDIRLVPISNGTVLDHLPVGTALKILEILGLGKPDKAVTIAINTESKRLGHKDLVFIEGKVLSKGEINKIGLIAKGATLNVIKDKKVTRKEELHLPKEAIGIIECSNPKCITNIEGIPTKFSIEENPLRGKCFYCERKMTEQDIKEGIK